MNGVIAVLRDIVGLVQQIDPVIRFVGFFQSDAHFADEVGLALGVFRFSNQRPNGRRAAPAR